MIQERKTVPPLERIFFDKLLFRDPDAHTEYIIPNHVNAFLEFPNHMTVLVAGPKDNLQVKGIYGNFFSFNELAPAGTKFSIVEYGNMVRTNVEDKQIILPVQKRHYDTLVYGIFHAIGRLHFHEDPEKHQKSLEAHKLVHSQIIRLQAPGKFEMSPKLMDRSQETEAWKVVCQEEREVSKYALGLIAGLEEKGYNPIPQIQTEKQLKRLVNTTNLQRTLDQFTFDPRKTERFIGIRMALTGQEIATALHIG
jgi:hypothetical protein